MCEVKLYQNKIGMHLKKIAVLLGLLLIFNYTKAGEIDPTYITRFKTKLNFRLLVNKNEFRYSIAPLGSINYEKKELQKAQLNFGSFIPISTGFAFNFMFGGFGYDFRFTNKYFNPSGKEVTNFRDFRLSILGKKISVEAFYDRFHRNFFNRNEKLFESLFDFNGAINSNHWGISMRINTNDSRFSYKAAFAQTEFQKKSAASFLIWYGHDNYQLQRNGGLILDSAVQKYYDTQRYIYFLKQQVWFVTPGFASNLVYKKFYFASAIYFGAGLQFNRQYSDTSIAKKINLPLISKARASIGFNAKSVYTGIFANVDYTQSSFQTMATQFFNYKIGLFVGIRLIKETKTKEEKKEEKKILKQDKNKRA